MIDFLISIFFNSTVYIKFSASTLFARYVEKKRIIEEKPLLAVKKGKKVGNRVVGFGKDASIAKSKDPENISVHNAFSHPRTFFSNFEVAEAALRHLIYMVIERRIIVRPIVVLHPLEKLEGGITQIEFRGLMELGESIGGRKVYIWTGHTLADNYLLNKQFLEENCLTKPDSTISEM